MHEKIQTISVLIDLFDTRFGFCLFRAGQTAAGLFLHRHMLSQQRLRVCLLLLPTGVILSNNHSGKKRLRGGTFLFFFKLYQE